MKSFLFGRTVGGSWLRSLLSLIAGLTLTGSLLFPFHSHAAGAAEQRVRFTNSIRPLRDEAAATARAVAAEHLSNTLEIEVPLRMRNYGKLVERIAAGNPVPEPELERDYLPLASDYAAVTQWLAGEGFTITQTDPRRLSVFARGTVAQLQKSLSVEMVQVTVRGRTYHSARTHPSLPMRIASGVLGVNGLQPHLQAIKRSSGPLPQTANKAPYLVNEILGAYNARALGVTGSGQTIGILIDTVATASDLKSFWTANSVVRTGTIEAVNVTNVSLPAASGEETMDEEWSGGIAPGAKVRVYASGNLDYASLDKALQRIISDVSTASPAQPNLHQLTISLGLDEADVGTSQMQTDSQFFATLANAGVSIFASSGDGGSNPNGSGNPGGRVSRVEYYASDPSVTGVGGTSLTLNASTGAETSETAWSDSGGGASTYFSRPSWQTGNGVPAGTARLVPDVSLVADPNTGAYVFVNGSQTTYGGTSLSAPAWAGFCALINEARSKAGLSPLGMLNPKLYPLLGTSSFRDITSGNNGAFSATAGYDEVTGLGVPNVASLLKALSGTTAKSTVAPAITGFSPATGGIATSVLLSGSNFGGATAVQFNGVGAVFNVNSATQIVATVPTGATTGRITVTNAIGTGASASDFNVVAPAVSSFSPASGAVGASVTIGGAYFAGATGVNFNGVPAAFSANSDTQITATVPTGATTGPIGVTNAIGTGTSSGVFTVNSGTTPASGNSLYSTGFETSEGYDTSLPLAGQNGWLISGQGGNGLLTGAFPGQGNQAYIGSFAPRGAASEALYEPVNYTPNAGDAITFSVQMDIEDSTGFNARDAFRWSVYNASDHRLFSIAFDNATNIITYVLDDGNYYSNDSAVTLVNGTVYTLTVTLDFSHNTWGASLSGTPLASNQPITTSGAALTLGDIDAVWILSSSRAGNNYMVFDNYSITKTSPSSTIATSASPSNGGTTHGGGIYNNGATATVAATPNAGYGFVNWTESGTSVSTAANYSFTVSGDRSLVANFQPVVSFTLSTSASPADSGTTSGDGSYPDGTLVTVEATPNGGYSFVNWTESGTSVSTAAGYSFILSGNRSLVANFQPIVTSTIATSASPAGSGTTSGDGSYPDGTVVTLVATPAPGYGFVSWTDTAGAVSTSPSYSFTVSGNRTLVANFQQILYYSVNASASPVGSGVAKGSGAYAGGADVTVIATPYLGYHFVSWTESGTSVNTSATYTFTVRRNRTLVANFEPVIFDVGIPAISDSGKAAMTATIQNPGRITRGSAVLTRDSRTVSVVALQGRVAPGVSGTFASFSDPVIDEYGYVAFLATIGGLSPTVTAANNVGIWTNAPDGTLRLVRRTGDVPDSTAGSAKIASFGALSIHDLAVSGTDRFNAEVVYTAALTGGAATNFGMWARFIAPGGASANRSIVCKGITALQGITVKSFSAFDAVPYVSGQGRTHVTPGYVTFKALLSSSTQALIDATTSGSLSLVAKAGAPVGSALGDLRGATWVAFNPPISGAAPDPLFVFLGTCQTPPAASGTATVPAKTWQGVFIGGTAFEPVALVTGTAPDAAGIPLSGVTFTGFTDPVSDAGTDSVAFLGAIKGPGIVAGSNDVGLWWTGTSGTLALVVQAGTHPSYLNIPAGTTIKSFLAIALPPAISSEGVPGPLFVAKLAGPGIGATNDTVLCAVTSAGGITPLIQTGITKFTVNNTLKTVKALDVIGAGAAPATRGVTRSFNGARQVTCRATFVEDNSRSAVTITVP